MPRAGASPASSPSPHSSGWAWPPSSWASSPATSACASELLIENGDRAPHAGAMGQPRGHLARPPAGLSRDLRALPQRAPSVVALGRGVPRLGGARARLQVPRRPSPAERLRAGLSEWPHDGGGGLRGDLDLSGEPRAPPSRRPAVRPGHRRATMLLVGWARIVLRAHWPTDVLGGLLLGTACAAAAAWWDSTHPPRRPPDERLGREEARPPNQHQSRSSEMDERRLGREEARPPSQLANIADSRSR